MPPSRTSRNIELLPEDRDLCRRDSELPGLATLLDPETFAGTLDEAVPDAEITSALPLYARYKPQMNLLMQYEITTRSGEKTTVYAKAYGPDAPPHLEKAKRKPGVTSSVLGAGRFVVEDLETSVFPFPNDGSLKQLRYFGDGEKGAKMLRFINLSDAPLETLRYKPERRYVARHPEGAGAVVKFYVNGHYDAARKNASAFGEGFKTTGILRLADVIGMSEDYSAIATSWVEGTSLESALRGTSGEEMARLAGAALSELHGQEVYGLKHTTRQEEVNELSALAGGISFTIPDIAEKVYALVARISPVLLCAPLSLTAIHGDFYDEQAIISPDDSYITILDLDRAMFGDPATDLGNFAAHLEVAVLCGDISPDKAAGLESSLLRGYDPTGNSDVWRRFTMYKAACLIKLAPVPFRRRWHDWPDATRRIIARASETAFSI